MLPWAPSQTDLRLHLMCQSKYAKSIVKKFGLENDSHKRTPTPTHLKLSKDEKGLSVDHSLNRSMISSLLYLTTSRPDITFAVRVCARYQVEPKTGSADDRKNPSPDNDSSEKTEENVPEHIAHERRCKKKAGLVINVEELTYDEEPLTNIVTPSIAKRLQRRKENTVAFEDSPSRISTGKSPVGPIRSWSKVVNPTTKRKDVSSSESEFDVEKDVQDITAIKRSSNKMPHDVRSKVPLDNASLHYVKNVQRWKYVIQRRVALERELGKDALKCKEVMELIEAVGLMKTFTHIGPCYENLIKEFVVTIPDGCDDLKIDDYGKVYVRGILVTFSTTVINKFLGILDEPQAKLEVTDDQVCKEITTK
ncbi:uncharacterized protein LOC127079289 [Lathyrus oleraceus]|uniref:uncharacterized protein LOC127079289 n=1 Tax=Pisum sativum TaxID=3888 RepID=UPI0021CE2B92|nr:uncharacterized protein LOC127079289 [Pisum sativum]